MCEYEGCDKEAIYALYELRDITKIWRHYCKRHDELIAQRNAQLKKEYPNANWREVYQDSELKTC